MVDRIKKYAKIVSERDGFFMFLRAQLSSQLATIIDFIITIGLAKLFSVYYVYATFAGSFFGGIVIVSLIISGHSGQKIVKR